MIIIFIRDRTGWKRKKRGREKEGKEKGGEDHTDMKEEIGPKPRNTRSTRNWRSKE